MIILEGSLSVSVKVENMYVFDKAILLVGIYSVRTVLEYTKFKYL